MIAARLTGSAGDELLDGDGAVQRAEREDAAELQAADAGQDRLRAGRDDQLLVADDAPFARDHVDALDGVRLGVDAFHFAAGADVDLALGAEVVRRS